MKRRMTKTDVICPPEPGARKVRPPAEPEPAAALAERTIRVVVVEDDDWLREHQAADISNAPGLVCVQTYANGEDAIQGIPNDAADVVLMDIGLPGMGGVECVQKLKQVSPSIQVVMVTVYAGSDHVFAALLAGADGYLLKRATSLELAEAIRKVHRGESPMDPRIARQVVQYFGQLGRNTSALQGLTARESDVLECLAKGAAYKEITAQLGMAMGTLICHIKSIYQKLHIHSRGEAAALYYKK